MWVKGFQLFVIVIGLSHICGCAANTCGLTEEQQTLALAEYPPCMLNIASDDGFWAASGKVAGRVLLFPVTFGMSELILSEEREESFRKYALKLYYSSFFSKPRAAVIEAFGAPARITTDGKDGEIYIYERVYMTGGVYHENYSSPPQIHKEIREFYFTADDQCYKWRTATE